MSRQRYICFDPSTGKIIHTVYYQKEDLPESAKSVHLVVDADLVAEDYYVCDGVLVKKPDKPTLHHVFDYSIKEWKDPRSLEAIREFQWELIKEERTKAWNGGFTWNGYVFDSTPEARTNISGTAQLAALNPAEFSTNWTIADNSTVPLDGFQMIEVGKALGAHVLGAHTKSVALREQIYNTTSKEEVESISW